MTLITKEIEKENETEYKILRINLDERWTASDFCNLFESLSILNNIFIEIETINLIGYQINNELQNCGTSKNYINLNGELYKKLNFSDTYENSNIISNKNLFNINFHRPELLEKNDLKIKEIKYASPGWCDLIGFGKIVENVFELIKFYIPNENQKIQNEIAELDLIEKKIALIQKYDFYEKDKERILDIRNNSIRNLKLFDSLEKIKSYEIKEYN